MRKFLIMLFVMCACVLFGGIGVNADYITEECDVWVEYYNGNITEEEAESECLKIELDYWTEFYMTSTVAETTIETTTTTVATTETKTTTTVAETETTENNFITIIEVVEILADETTTTATTETTTATTTTVSETNVKSNNFRIEYVDYENDVVVVEEKIVSDNTTIYRYTEYDGDTTFSSSYVEIEVAECVEIPVIFIEADYKDNATSEVLTDTMNIYIDYYGSEIDEQTAREKEVISLINYYIENPTAPNIDLTF